jgi:hypothetical protein
MNKKINKKFLVKLNINSNISILYIYIMYFDDYLNCCATFIKYFKIIGISLKNISHMI